MFTLQSRIFGNKKCRLLQFKRTLKAAFYCPVPLLDDTIIAFSPLLVIGKTAPIYCQFIATQNYQLNSSNKVSISSQKSTSLAGAAHNRIERMVIACERSL